MSNERISPYGVSKGESSRNSKDIEAIHDNGDDGTDKHLNKINDYDQLMDSFNRNIISGDDSVTYQQRLSINSSVVTDNIVESSSSSDDDECCIHQKFLFSSSIFSNKLFNNECINKVKYNISIFFIIYRNLLFFSLIFFIFINFFIFYKFFLFLFIIIL